MRRAGFALASFLAAAPAVAQDRSYQPVLPAPVPGQPQRTDWPPGGPPQPVAAVPGQPAAPGQPAPQPPAADDPLALQYLQGWEKAMAGVKTFAVKADMTATDKGKNRTEKFSGDIWCMAPNLTRLNLVKKSPAPPKGLAEEYTAFISNGKVVYHYDGPAKTLTVAKLGPNGAGNNLLLDVMAGMTAKAALERFEVKSLQPNNPRDPYLYLELKPKWKEDKGEFEVMQLILIPPTIAGRAYMPRFVKLVTPGGQVVQEWDFPDPKVNPNGMAVKDFDYQPPPRDWKVQQADAPAQPQPKGLVAQPPGPKR